MEYPHHPAENHIFSNVRAQSPTRAFRKCQMLRSAKWVCRKCLQNDSPASTVSPAVHMVCEKPVTSRQTRLLEGHQATVPRRRQARQSMMGTGIAFTRRPRCRTVLLPHICPSYVSAPATRQPKAHCVGGDSAGPAQNWIRIRLGTSCRRWWPAVLPRWCVRVETKIGDAARMPSRS